jgi:HEAT repeat protein
VAFFLFALAVGTAIVMSFLRRRKIDAAWSAAADELHFGYLMPGFFSMPQISGRREGISLKITASGRDSHTSFKVAGLAGLPWNLAISSKGSWVSGSVSGEKVLVNDPYFDEEVKISGAPEEVVALMDAETRRAVKRFVKVGGKIGWADLTLERSGVLKDWGEIVELANVMMTVAARLGRGPVPQLLLENVQSDPIPAVRVRNFQLLVDRFGSSEQTKRAVQVALGDRDPFVRVLGAAHEQGEKGMAILQAVAADPRSEVDVRVLALKRLVAIFGYANARPLVIDALAAPDRILNGAAVLAAGTAHDVSQLERITALADAGDEALTETVATALGKLGDARAEVALIGLLGRESTAVRIAAAAALGLIGTVHAVEPLLPLSKGLLGNADLHKAARDSIRRIQSRLGDAEAGRVSVASVDEAAGAVSLAAGGGEVSLAQSEEESGQGDSLQQSPTPQRIKP